MKKKNPNKSEVECGVGKESEKDIIKLTIIPSMPGSPINRLLLSACRYCQHFTSISDGLL